MRLLSLGRLKMKPNYKRKEKRPTEKRLIAFATGKLIPLSAVSDPLYATKMFGEGVAIIPEEDLVVAPCGAIVNMVSYTMHCVGLENEQGDMILIHAGINNPPFRKRGFESLVTEGMKVRAGSPLIRLDRKFLESQNADLTVCLVITNSHHLDDYRILEGDQVLAGRTPIMERRENNKGR